MFYVRILCSLYVLETSLDENEISISYYTEQKILTSLLNSFLVSKVGDITQDQQVRGKINDIIRKMVNHLGGRAEVGEPRVTHQNKMQKSSMEFLQVL